MPLDISVIICTHNPRRDYFLRVLKALHGQTLPKDRWEFLVIDNCSAIPVGDLFDFSWHPDPRVVREDKLGLTQARLRGIREAKAPLLVFVDDDNVLEPNYLSGAQDISVEYPRLGAWSGSCIGEFEEQPAKWAQKYTVPLCVWEFDRDYWCNYPFQNQSMPSGAGMCLRADAARHYLHLNDSGQRPMMLDRTGNSLLSGGDVDIALSCTQIGYGMGQFIRLRLTHLIPAFRVQKLYLLNLTEAMALSGEIIELYHPGPMATSGSGWKRKIANALRSFFLSSIDHEFQRAHQRGMLAGRKLVADLKKSASGAPLV